MDIAIARDLARTSLRIGREIIDTLHFLKANLPEEEYRSLAPEIAMALDGIHVALMNVAIARYPELEKEIDAGIEKYGRYLGP